MKSKNNLLKRSYYQWYRFDKKFVYFIGKLKSIWERITKGYCYEDIWELKDFYLEIFINSLRDLAENGNSYPSDFSSPDQWKEYLLETAKHFENSKEDFSDGINKIMPYVGTKSTGEYDEFYKAISEDWLNFEKRQAEWRKLEFKKGMEMLTERFDDLWD